MWAPEKRQRVTRACDQCKRRKKQVRTRDQPARFYTSHSVHLSPRPAKGRSLNVTRQGQALMPRLQLQCSGTHPCVACISKSATCSFSSNSSDSNNSHDVVGVFNSFHKAPKRKAQLSAAWQRESLKIARLTGSDDPAKDSATDDETPIQNPGRLLQDGEGRLCEHRI